MSGKVYLVGAGPGLAAYLTVRGQQLLQQAEVLVHDALVSAELRSLIPSTCQQFDVGKRGGRPSTPQSEINQLLVQQCQQGKQVLRLKSGDPFIFGRTQQEIQALQEAGCAFELVPGISSALAAPLLASIPLTDPVLSHSFAVLTGHDLDLHNWELLAGLETLVILMGTRSLGEITHQLISHGMRQETPIALIRWASQPQQQIWQGTLLNIAQLTKGEKLSPCVMVIGEVVRLREFLQMKVSPAAVSPRPLVGKTVLVTRSSGQSSQFSDLLTAAGARVLEMPALEIRPPASWADLDRAIANRS
ncbi:MAG: uroporphyrinogen-III C-methyltransferase [Leptolyngbya sp. SIO4C5]|nr:uroporphyrinogen-III C-methyltransferase [Leptolyngbya sp. SIO4C5]